MKYFIAFTLLFAVASARVLPPAVIASDNPEIQEIIAAIQSPSTDPATAAALEQLLLQILGLAVPEPIDVGPAIVDEYEPISIGPALIDFPLHDGGAVTAPSPASPSFSPLVHIIIKINQAVAGNPVVIETVKPPAPTPVHVVEEAEKPEQVVVIDKPILVPEPVDKPETPESIIIAEPIIPAPVIVLPDILN